MYLDYPFILSKINLGQYKMEQQTPISTKSRVKVLKSQKAQFFIPSFVFLGGLEGIYIFHLIVQMVALKM